MHPLTNKYTVILEPIHGPKNELCVTIEYGSIGVHSFVVPSHTTVEVALKVAGSYIQALESDDA